MKLYNKPLQNMAALQREKARLRRRTKRDGGVFSFKESSSAAAKGSTSGGEDSLFSQITSLFGSGLLGPVLPVVAQIISGRVRQRLFRFLLLELGGGYLKWKGVSLAWRFLRSRMRRR